MKKLLIVLFIGLTSLVTNAQTEQNDLKGTIKVEVDGLSCPYCAYGLEKNLKKVEGIENIKIDVENAFVLLSITEGKSIPEAIIRKNIEDAGFTPKKISSQDED